MISAANSLRAGILCLVWASVVAQASEFTMEGGRFLLNGQLSVQDFNVESGAQLWGSGYMEGSLTVDGTLAPGDGDSEPIGNITISSSLVFNAGSTYACYAFTDTSLDQISAEGPVSGTCQLDYSQAVAAIPLGQVVVGGGAGSDYAGFTSSTNITLTNVNNDLILTDITGDSDGNNIPDYWEVEYFGGRTNCNPAEDNDTDLMDNWSEYVAGTVPTNALSRLFMTPGAEHSDSDLVLTWSSVADRNYILLRSTNLLDNQFSVLSSNIAATPPANTYTDSVAQLEHYYYRIQVEH